MKKNFIHAWLLILLVALPAFADGMSQMLPVPLPTTFGGTGTSTAPTDGQIPIGNTATGKALFNSITAGTNITITPGAGTLQIDAAAGGVTSVTGTANQIDSTGGATPVLSLASTIILPGTSALRLQNGTTAQRPAGADGDLRLNTSIGTGMVETFSNAAWRYIPSLVGTSLSDGDFVQWDAASSSFDNVPITGDATVASGGVLTLATVPIDKGGTNNAALGVSALGMYAGDGSKIIQVTGTALQQFRVNAGGTAIEAFTPSAGGVTDFTGDGILFTNSASTGSVTLTKGTVWSGAMDSITSGTGNTGFGNNALTAVTTSNNSTAFGFQAGDAVTTANCTAVGSNAMGAACGADSTFVGASAGLVCTAAQTTGVGANALDSLTTATGCVAVGNSAGATISTANNGTFVGYFCGDQVFNADCTAVGAQALGAFAGANCTAVGSGALGACSAADTTGVGKGALQNVTSGTQNSALGYLAGSTIATSGSGTFVGFQAGDVVTNANCTAVGSNALGAVAGADCSAFGTNALLVCTAAQISGFGSGCLDSLTSGTQNSGFGYNTLTAITTQAGNTGFGWQCLDAVTSDQNSAFGASAGGNLSTGQDCAFFGNSAGASATTGSNHCAFGRLALASVTLTNSNNSAFGFNSLNQATGGDNCGFGSGAGDTVSSGTGNICLGKGAGGTTLTTGSNNILIGVDADTVAAGNSNYINIGPTVILRGSANVTTVNGSTAGTLTWSAPERGANLKMIIINLNGFNDAGEVVTFPTAFTQVPASDSDAGAAATEAGATITATNITFAATAGAVSGTIVLTGM